MSLCTSLFLKKKEYFLCNYSHRKTDLADEPHCVVPRTSAADMSKDKSLGAIVGENVLWKQRERRQPRAGSHPPEHYSVARTMAIVIGIHFSKRE